MMKWIGIALVAAAAVVLLIIKSTGQPSSSSSSPVSEAPRVLLFADLGEAEDDCGCGQIIRAVRSAQERGIPTRENDEQLSKVHRVTTEPTVLIVDTDGKEQFRFEGESKATIQKLKAEIAKLPGGG